jgi:hypothetical protein
MLFCQNEEGRVLDITEIQNLCNDETIILTEHLLTRMRQRGIKYGNVWFSGTVASQLEGIVDRIIKAMVTDVAVVNYVEFAS